MISPCLTYKATPLNFYALKKGQTLSKPFLTFSENHAVLFHFRQNGVLAGQEIFRE